MTNYIIKRKKKKQDETKSDIIMAAAKIIKAEIRELTKSNEVYSTTEEIANSDQSNEWVPEPLKLLLSYLIPAKIMQLAVGQCIVQAAKPKVSTVAYSSSSRCRTRKNVRFKKVAESSSKIRIFC